MKNRKDRPESNGHHVGCAFASGNTLHRVPNEAESTETVARALELPAANPFATAKGVAQKLGVAFTTAQRALGRLERLGIVQQTGTAKRDRVYCAKALFEILEEPARLAPVGGVK